VGYEWCNSSSPVWHVRFQPTVVAFYRLGIAAIALLVALSVLREVKQPLRFSWTMVAMGVMQGLYQLCYFAAYSACRGSGGYAYCLVCSSDHRGYFGGGCITRKARDSVRPRVCRHVLPVA
jgi:hypothetical protein